MSAAGVRGREATLQVQRARIVDAMVCAADELGFVRVTIGGVCSRARVSRATFYEAFDGLQDCFTAVIDEGYECAHALISLAFEGEEHWLDGVRAALASLLALFDEEPKLARVWCVQAFAAGPWALARREYHIAALTETIGKHWVLSEGAQVNPLAVRGVVESILGIIQMRLLADSEEPLLGLLGSLMGLIGAVYNGGRAATVEMERGEAYARAMLARRQRPPGSEDIRESVEIPSALRDARAHRARACLSYLAENPGASNREVARAVGIARQEQISKLLARLNALGLLLKRAALPGGANAWSLTSHGMRVTRALRVTHESTYTISPTSVQGPTSGIVLDACTDVTLESLPCIS
ncbi:MAG TPA: hypothetical protein VGL57_06725 [Solirubrobacteraceae bacterium]|jgi:AcrR family transcriptional regulator